MSARKLWDLLTTIGKDVKRLEDLLREPFFYRPRPRGCTVVNVEVARGQFERPDYLSIVWTENGLDLTENGKRVHVAGYPGYTVALARVPFAFDKLSEQETKR